jgi:hypothetical protein
MGAFILASCYIDYLSCYYFNCESTKEHYIDFVNEFLEGYNGKDLYEALRCKLVHNYTEGGRYGFIHDKPDLHLKKRGNKTIINLNNFISDIERAKDKYFKLIDRKEKYRSRLISRYKKVGILQSVKF